MQSTEQYFNGNVTGIVFENNIESEIPVEGATVKVFTSDGIPYSHTSTDATGKYTIGNLPVGIYLISATKNGYQSININVSLANGIKLLADESMVSIIGNINNTVSGIIRDNLGNVVSNALVALYKIENNKEILVATTYTNSIGKYMFGNVIDGNYLVKSKLGR